MLEYLIIPIFLILITWVGYKVKKALAPPLVPHLSRQQYWGPGETPTEQNESIRPFKIEFNKEIIDDLKSRLKNTRYVEPYEGIAQQYGFNQKYLKQVVEFWQNEYDFGERETFMNQYPQFVTNIQGLDIHYVHIKPVATEKSNVIPLLLLHGWPMCFREFFSIIPLLTKDNHEYDFVFELIIPDLPGFAFSQAPAKSGMGPVQMAVVISNLMHRLGYNQYCIQGGDWGSIVASRLITLYPEEVMGYHTNMPLLFTPLSFAKMFIGSLWPTLFLEEKLVKRLYPISEKMAEVMEEFGYFHEHATKPDTIGVALDDSPAALIAWTFEKIAQATNYQNKNLIDGDIPQKFSLLDLLDASTVYWITKSATTSTRIYAEGMAKAQITLQFDSIPTAVPIAAARFPHEMVFNSEWQLKEKYTNIIQVTDFEKGGHFAALEVPHLLADDIWMAVKRFIEFNLKNKKL